MVDNKQRAAKAEVVCMDGSEQDNGSDKKDWTLASMLLALMRVLLALGPSSPTFILCTVRPPGARLGAAGCCVYYLLFVTQDHSATGNCNVCFWQPE